MVTRASRTYRPARVSSPVTRVRRFRAFDSRTGKELWSTSFDDNVTAIPITYMDKNGKQYVAVVAATNGQGNNESLHVFALP